jgi:diguanylate cyclase (GGDEF)-like protein
MMLKWFATEAAFDELLHAYRARADRVMVGMNVFLMLVCLAIAPYRDTWVAALLIGLPTLALSYWLAREQAGSLLTRLYMGCAFMAYTGLIIHQTGGDIEAHFSAFGLIGVLLYYRDWRVIGAATVFIYLHHMILGYAQTLGVPVYVFDDDRFWSLFGLHVAYFLPFVGMMGYLAIWLRREGFEEQHVINLARHIVQGNLAEADGVAEDDRDMPLIAAVVAMKNRLLDLLRVMPVPAAVIRIDTETIVNVNAAWIRTLGPLDADGRFGESPIWAEPGTWDLLTAKLREASDKLLDKVEVGLKRRDGTPILCELSLILHEDVEPVMAILTIEDITQRRQAERTMHRMAFRDLLTDLPNRASLQAELEQALAAWCEAGTPFAVAMLDLDGFKPVNDTWGHDAGDEVLKVVGARLTAVNRDSDLAARLGGDEFAVVLRECPDAEAAARVAERFVASLSQPVHLRGSHTAVCIGTSVGVAHIADGASDAETLLKQADSALYAAKAAGKNQVAVHRPGAL